MKKLTLIAMLIMLTGCGNKFDGTYSGYQFATIFTEGSTFLLTVSGDEARMANNYNDVIEVLEADVSDNTLAIKYRDKMLYFTFSDDEKSLSCKGCFVRVWKRVEEKKVHKPKNDKSLFQSLIELFY